MNYLFIALGLLLLAGTATPLRAAFDCIPDTGCPKDEWPPKCCKKPPCEVFRALQVNKAFRNLQRQRLAELSQPGGGENVVAQMRADISRVNREIATCGEPSGADFSGQFQPVLKNDCMVSVIHQGVPPEVMSESQALDEINACSELISAKYAFGRATQPLCELQRERQATPAARIAISLGAAQTQIDMLEKELWRYWNVCTITFSSETAQRVAEFGVQVLRDETQLTERPKVVPKRAKKG